MARGSRAIPSASVRVWRTAREARSTTVIAFASALATRTSAPSAVIATLSGRAGTSIAAMRSSRAVSSTAMRDASGTVTQTSAPSGETASGAEDCTRRTVLVPDSARSKDSFPVVGTPSVKCATPSAAIPPIKTSGPLGVASSGDVVQLKNDEVDVMWAWTEDMPLVV